ncbi:hypothetical protein JCM10450v2_000608 [Rhodotorula kratochvilovae]
MPRASKSIDGEEPLSRQSLKAAVWYTVTKIAQEEELSLPFAASEHFVATLAEVVFQQALSLGKDLERFAKHAGRLTINADDVKLAARRNEPLYELLATSAQQHGLTLADLKADAGAGAKAKKQVKAPRLAAGTSAAAGKEKEKKEAKSRSTSAEGKGKGKGKARAREDQDEDLEDGVILNESEPELAGGFVKASALKSAGGKGKGKGRAVDHSEAEEDEEDEDARGGDSGDESEEVGLKRRKGGKGVDKGAKRRKSAG